MPEPNLQRQQSVLNLLQNLKGTESLKQLFWSELNYDRVNKSLSRRGWKDNISGLLAEDPVLFASGADDFHVIYGRLTSDKLLIGDERPVVSKLLQEHPYALFVFSNSKQEHFHFLNVKYDDDVQKRRMFRRITVGPNERLRTASERIALLDLADISSNLFGLSPLAVQQRHDEAFDVEPVTKEFFSEYRRIFEEVEEAITGFARDKERKRLYTQRLFNRLMFIAFIQKKGWLKFNGDTDYLAALWKAHLKDNSVSDKNFYRDRLKALFFFGLNSSNEVNQVGINKGAFLTTLIGNVPYLNGGLFEEDEDDKNEAIKIPDKAIGAVLNGLFAKFNFTVTESTPLDVEVAVDPEMLGKIFEELVTARHETGSYYTPKPIVSFMCREALKGYLKSEASAESTDAISRFVEKHEPDDLRDAEAILDALRKITVCDPACGSGAYLLGMLHELLDLRAALFQTRKLDARSVYERKLEIIQSNIYGVDLDPFAVNIARLRLWLSLAVDFEGSKPEPLPNLDFKVEVGDSILGPGPSGGLQMGLRKQLIDEFLQLKAEYLTSHHARKKELKEAIAQVKVTIASFGNHKKSGGFDWAVEFAEIFINKGFDVVLANPPYVRHELIKGQKPSLKALFPEVFLTSADLYCYFYARGAELLKERGTLSFISSSKWLRVDYGLNLRRYLSDTCGIRSITDFGELPVFDTAATFPCILVAQKKPSQNSGVRFTPVRSLSAPYPDVSEIVKVAGRDLSEGCVKGTKWLLADPEKASRIRQMESIGVPLGEYVRGRIFNGIKTGCKAAFIIDNRTREQLVKASRKNAEIIHPFAAGDDVRRWRVEDSGEWLIVTRIGIDIDRYPAVFHHLSKWKSELETRSDKGNYWWELRPCDYYDHFERPKIVYPEMAKEPRFTLDKSGVYTNNKAFIIPTDDLFLLAVLNSQPVWEYLKETCSVIGDADRGGRLELRTSYLLKLPIPPANSEQKKHLADLSQRCLQAQGKDCAAWEHEITTEVEKLYQISQASKR
ncbi:MAG: Eco57I restriction-modification methylase domain-containing protein [Acidobacteriaceae bacterium]